MVKSCYYLGRKGGSVTTGCFVDVVLWMLVGTMGSLMDVLLFYLNVTPERPPGIPNIPTLDLRYPIQSRFAH